MIDEYINSTVSFDTILDFMRFGVSRATAATLYFGHGTDNAQDDIRSLILGCLDLPWDMDPQWLHARLTADEKLLLCRQLVRRIHDKVPVPYLTHQAYFCGLSFYVDERVLIPRSPIGELIQQQCAPWVDDLEEGRILDLCTGSGCIAIACCYAFPTAWVDAVDLSEDALKVAEINRQKHACESQLQLIHSDCFAAITPQHQYDLIISNPPYVGEEEMLTLPAEYRHEPVMALETENNGLAIVDKILMKAPDYLTPHGVLIVEVGNSQEALMDAYPDMPFVWLDFEQGGHGVFVLTRAQLQDYWNRHA